MKKKLKIRKRRSLDSSEFHSTRIRKTLKFGIWRTFPDKEDRMKYMSDLYKGLERESYVST